MPMLEQNRQPETKESPFDASSDLKQRRQMLIALALLLAATGIYGVFNYQISRLTNYPIDLCC